MDYWRWHSHGRIIVFCCQKQWCLLPHLLTVPPFSLLKVNYMSDFLPVFFCFFCFVLFLGEKRKHQREERDRHREHKKRDGMGERGREERGGGVICSSGNAKFSQLIKASFPGGPSGQIGHGDWPALKRQGGSQFPVLSCLTIQSSIASCRLYTL